MLALAVTLALLAVPVAHHIRSHAVLRPGHAPTAHEIAHRQRPMWLRAAANLAWLAYLVGSLAAGLALR
jgi:hypothetical protein